MSKENLLHLDRVGVSVVIVTYNGREKIMPTLMHLAKQKGIDFEWEVLLIDNNSTDNTAQIALEFCETNHKPFTLRILKEQKPGTMYARHKGMLECKYRYMLYCDDDNWLNDLYVKTAFDIISQDSGIAAVGGLGIIEYEQGFTPPNWMVETYERSFGTGSQGENDGDITHLKGSLYTAGAIFDRLWLDKLYSLGYTSSLKGRDGKSLVAGEDTELTLALKLIGGKLYYSSQMHFKHLMPKERIKWTYLKHLWNGFGYSNYIVSPYKNIFEPTGRIGFFKRFLGTLKRLVVLYYKSIFKTVVEGNKVLLMIELEKGTLKAMIFAHRKIKSNQRMVKLLSSSNKE